MANQSSTASFVTEVLATTGRLEKESLSDKLSKLSSRIESAKDEFCEDLQKRHDDFFPNLHSAQELSQRVANLSHEMQTVRKIEQDIRTQLSVPADEFENLTLQLQETNHILGWLDRLSKIHESMEAVSSAIDSHNYEKAVKHWEIINTLLLKETSPADSEIKILEALRHSHDIEQEKLICSIKESWSERVKWIRPDETRGETSIAVLNVACGDKDFKALTNTVQAMHTIGLLDSILKIFSNQLKDYVFHPILSVEKVSVNVTSSKEKKSLQITKGNCEPAPVPPAQVFAKLTEVFKFLSATFNIDYKPSDKSQSVRLITTLGELISEDLLSKIIKDCLTHSVPSTNKEFESYTKTVQLTDQFNQALCKIGFIDNDNKILPDFVNNVDMLFSNRKCQEILVKARTLMMSDIHNMEKVQEYDQHGDELPPLEIGGKTNKKAKMAENQALAIDIKLQSLFKFPKCMISSSTKDLVKLMYETLHEATETPMPGAVQLFASAREIIELYCSVVPKYHKNGLEELPQLSAAYHNNCMYIAHHMMTMGFQYSKHLPKPMSDGMATFIDMVPRMRRLGVECFINQRNRQRSQLQEYLKGANGFVAIETSLESAKAVKQVLHHIQVVAKTWKGVLPEHIYCKSIGFLVNYVICEIINIVTSLEDISEDSAKQIHSLMSLITDKVPQYYTDLEDDTPVAGVIQLNIKDWGKFKELGIVLDASMQDILDRWADGKGPLAHTFDSNEVKQLVKALFQNNERRANVLSKIK